MGSSSTKSRKITIDNSNPTSVIKVSDECVQRIRGYGGSGATGVSMGNEQVSQQSSGQPVFYEPSLTSIQLRQDKVKALQENDMYWDRRIESLQKNHQDINRVMEEEYKKAVQEVGDVDKGKKRNYGPAPCGKTKDKIIECYKKHKNEPIRCAKEVQEFSECVDRSTLMIATQ